LDEFRNIPRSQSDVSLIYQHTTGISQDIQEVISQINRDIQILPQLPKEKQELLEILSKNFPVFL